ncbi:MAG: ribosomal protein S18-alanine N-acetyltransferase [Thermodesulfovibrio sp.]|nr:ribosomal protein S18-alanine N-acetyltransferase [Thermodesulfovibrio sp.]
MDEPIIRDLSESDLNQVLEISKESFIIPWSLKSFINELLNQNSILKVAELNGEVIGYVVARKIVDEAEILSLAVKKDFRRKGIATKLMKSVLNEIKDFVKSCFLDVRVSNEPAIKLYEKLGFKKVGIRKKYYLYPEEDALLMKLDIS